MGRGNKQAEPDDAPGAPEWMVTFSDCMTLLLTFFVLLLSFSSFDDRIFRSLKVIYSNGLTSITPMKRSERDAFLHLPPIRYLTELDRGSEKPTTAMGLKEEGSVKETTPVDLAGGMVFSISSKDVFWGKGTAISSEGRRVMNTMALFLKEVPNRIVISESGPTGDGGRGSEHIGLPRAWALMEYLITKQNLDRKKFSISATSTLAWAPWSRGTTFGERTLEIVLLKRSIYN